MLKKIIEFLDKIIPGKGWRTMFVTALVGAALNGLASIGFIVTDQFTVAFTTIVMGLFAFLLRLMTTGPVGTKTS